MAHITHVSNAKPEIPIVDIDLVNYIGGKLTIYKINELEITVEPPKQNKQVRKVTHQAKIAFGITGGKLIHVGFGFSNKEEDKSKTGRWYTNNPVIYIDGVRGVWDTSCETTLKVRRKLSSLCSTRFVRAAMQCNSYNLMEQ